MLFSVALFILAPASHAQKTLHVAAAADLQPVMPAIAFGFEKKTGVKMVVSFGSSATLAQQIVNGAPFDAFFGADYTFPERVVAANLTSKAPTQYARGALVLYSRKDSPFNPLHLEALGDPRVTKIAVADGLHAPYGRAAYAALEKLQYLPKVREKLVVAENIGQAAQFVITGNAQLGLISRTLAASPAFQAAGTFVTIPSVTYPDILQYAVVMKSSKDLQDAEALLQYVLSEEVQGHLKDFGLDPVR